MWVRTIDDIAEMVRARRKQMGLSQVELARRVGVSRKWIMDFERGKPSAEVSLVLRTLAATGLHLDVRDPPRRDPSARETPAALLDAAREVLENHRPVGPVRTLSTRPPSKAEQQSRRA